MKTFAPLLAVTALSTFDGASAFTVRPPLATAAGNVVASRSTSTMIPATQLFMSTKEKEGTATIEETTSSAIDTTNGDASAPVTADEEEELSEAKTLLQKVKQAGTAGAISYALWELGFWGISIPVCSVTYYKVAGHWPDWSNAEDMEKLGAEAFAFVNFARLAVPLRIGLALSTTPWIDDNVVQKFMKKDGDNEGANEE